MLDRNLLIKANPLPMEANSYAKYESSLMTELKMGEKYTRIASKQIKSLSSMTGMKNVTVIGVHVRRTDYVQYRCS